MSLMTKRSFRHWQKSSKRSISKITKQHIVAIVIVIITIAPAAPQIIQNPKKENSKPPLLYPLQELPRHGNQIFKRLLPPNRTKGKGARSNAHTLKTSKGCLDVFNVCALLLAPF